jgi:hypothetical protein
MSGSVGGRPGRRVFEPSYFVATFQGIRRAQAYDSILATVLIEANGKEVRFLATDLEVGLRSRGTCSRRIENRVLWATARAGYASRTTSAAVSP